MSEPNIEFATHHECHSRRPRRARDRERERETPRKQPEPESKEAAREKYFKQVLASNATRRRGKVLPTVSGKPSLITRIRLTHNAMLCDVL